MVFSVSQIGEYLARKFRTDTLLKEINVFGEVTNFKYTDTGTSFFSLKDNGAIIDCMMTDSEVLGDGERVMACGDIGFYPKNGRTTLYVSSIEIMGQGQDYIKFEKLKRQLAQEGIFDDQNKKKLPEFPVKMGVITSESGAVIHDIISTAKNGYLGVEIILCPSKVQGENAVGELISGLRYFQRNPVDVIIIGRGGGSYEDLGAFNDESLIREIYACGIPIVSAVGHETDYTLCDFVSDARAATPTAAVGLCLPKKEILFERLENYFAILNGALNQKLFVLRDRLGEYEMLLSSKSPKNQIETMTAKKENLRNLLLSGYSNIISEYRYQLNKLDAQLNVLSPYNTLLRGYTIIRKNDKLVKSVKDTKPGDKLRINFCDGIVEVTDEKHI